MKTEPASQLSTEDGRLVDLVSKALVDPDLHTATRMRLRHDISKVLHETRTETEGVSAPEPEKPAHIPHDQHVAHMLEEILVDPDLNTDRRMRLHREIFDLVDHVR